MNITLFDGPLYAEVHQERQQNRDEKHEFKLKQSTNVKTTLVLPTIVCSVLLSIIKFSSHSRQQNHQISSKQS
jgi:hypothetical protein